jgi:membrane protein
MGGKEKMEQTILVNCTTTSSDFWSTASSIATVVSIMAVAAASIYRSSTMTPIEKLFISGMDRVWMRIVEGAKKIFWMMVFLLLANFFLPIFVMYLVKMWKLDLNPFPCIIFWFCRVCLLLALFWIVLWRLKPQFDHWISKSKSWKQKTQGLKDIVTLIYLFYALFVFPILSYNLIKGLPESFNIEKLSELFQEKWRAVLVIFIVEWVFFISLGIPGFIINFRRKKVYMKLLNPEDGKELFVYFKEDNMLVCGESEDIAKEDKYQCINMDEGKYILKNNDGGLKGQKN